VGSFYKPCGNPRSSSGTLPTSIGFTGQQYDPVTGQFLSADVVQGNAQGTSPYRYVMGDPETRTDPTGQRYTCGPGNSDCSGGGGSSGGGNNGGGSGGSGGGSNPCELSGGNPEYCGGGGSGGGSTGGCHAGGRDGASAMSCTGTTGCSSGTPPCYGNAKCLYAMQWLQKHWATQDNQLHLVLDAAQLAGNLLNILLNALGKGTAGLIIATLSVIGLLPSVLNLWEDWYRSANPNASLPEWALALAPALDGLATVANVLNGFVGLASWILDWSAGLIKGIVAHVQAIATNLVLNVVVGGGTGYAQEILVCGLNQRNCRACSSYSNQSSAQRCGWRRNWICPGDTR